jgi:ribokinase
MPAVEAALAIARRHGVRTVLDPAPAPDGPLPASCLDVDVISPNQTEAEVLTGIAAGDITGAVEAARRLRELGARRVALKLGDRGALWCDEHRERHVPTARVEVVDTTAAGDAFTAALTLVLAEGRAPIEAVRFACAAGTLAATRFGAQQAMPARAEVEKFLESLP